MWVKTSSGKYLKDPTIVGVNWFIRFDEDALMIYIKSRARLTKSVRSRIYAALVSVSISAELCVADLMYKSTAAFPPDYRGIVPCWVGEVVLTAPLPATTVFTCEMSVGMRPAVGKIHGS